MPDSNEDQKRLNTLLKNVNPAIKLTRKLKKDEDYDKVPAESREQAVARLAEARERPPPRFNLEEGGKKKKRKTKKKKKRKGGKKAEDLPPRRQNPRRSTSPSQLSREQLQNIRREARARAWSTGLRQRLDFDRSQAPPPPADTSDSSVTSSPPALQGTAPSANVARPVAQRRPTEDDEEDDDEHPKPIRGGKRKTKKRRRKKGGNDDDASKTLGHINELRRRAISKFREPFEDTPEFEQRLVQAFKAEGLSETQAQEAKRLYMIQHSTPATAAQRMRAAMARRSGGKKKRKTNRRRGKKDGRKRKTKTRKAGMDRKKEVKSVLKEVFPEVPAEKIASKTLSMEEEERRKAEYYREQAEHEEDMAEYRRAKGREYVRDNRAGHN